ncbi:MAG: monovalent cation/H+ antiporter subunit D family protein [Deltaproteobacteria bacterium]|nr:MAG: monovalent cation/H+ antiporter subunit D family protein [Deltaproteobacteria bacterium]
METFLELRPLWIVLLTPLTAVLIVLSHRRPNLREAWSVLASCVQLVLVASMIPEVLAGHRFEVTLLPLASGFDLVLRADALGMIFAGVASILWVATTFYSIGYMRALDEPHQTPYYASFALCISSAMGIAFAGNPLTFFVFYEGLTLATYPLVVHKRSEEAIRVGRKYLAYTLSAGLCMLLAIGWIQTFLPAHAFRAGGFLTPEMASPTSLKWIFLLFMLGVGVKAGIMPLHAWLPAAMIAPTPVSALLHAVAVVKAGVFGVIRVVYFVFGPKTLAALGLDGPLIGFAAFTIIVASIIALSQDNLKRRLAYSTISQLSYIVLGAALLSRAGLLGAAMHIANHAFMKITLFMCAGAVYAHLHVSKISEMKGIGRAMPFTMGAFAVAALAIAGTPPLPGFVTKWWLGQGAAQSGHIVAIWILIGSALLNALYFFPIIWTAFFRRSERFTAYNEGSLALVGPPIFTAACCFLLGMMPEFGPDFWDFAGRVVASIFGGSP